MMKWKWWILFAVLAAVFAGGMGYVFSKQEAKDQYREYAIAKGELDVTIQATGNVAPENRLEIKPPIAGRVERILVEEGARVHKGEILAWMSSTERAALLDAARARGPQELKKWESLYRPTPVIAPIDGTIILRQVEPGQTFTNTDSIFVLSDRLTVKAQVDETDIAQVKLQQVAEIRLDAYPDEKFSARVDQIAFDSKTNNNVTTYLVDVLPDKPPTFMRSGMTANVVLFVAAKSEILLVPNEALKTQGGRTIVLVRENSSGQQERVVHLGITDGKVSEVLSGLNDGEIILIPKINTAEKRSGGNPLNPMGGSRQKR